MRINHNKIALSILFLIIIAFAVVLFNSNAKAETLSLEQRVEQLEKNVPNLPNGFFVNGEVEGFYDDKTYDSGWDSRAELQLGISTNVPETLAVDWIGTSMTYDTHYSLDTSLNNTVQEKQLGFGNDKARIYLGETDAQRMGFAKTPKISAPLIFTETNYRIDHREKTVLTFGGWQYDNEFDFDSYRLKRETPWGIALGWDNDGNVGYYTGTVSLMGYADVSYMRIDAIEETGKGDQEGYAIGGSLHRFGVPMLWGVELWDDKNTGTYTKDDRLDYGVMYNVTDSTYVTAHRTENDDLGYDGNYYGIVHNIYQNYDPTKRADKQDGLEMGLYYHDKGGRSVFTGAAYPETQQILASVKYKF
jgi:hypothetical protein